MAEVDLVQKHEFLSEVLKQDHRVKLDMSTCPKFSVASWKKKIIFGPTLDKSTRKSPSKERTPSRTTAVSTEATKALFVGRGVLGHVELVELEFGCSMQVGTAI